MAKRTREIEPEIIECKRPFNDKKKTLIAHLDAFMRNQFFTTDTVLCGLLRDLPQVELWDRREQAGLSSVECYRPLTENIIKERMQLAELFKNTGKDIYDTMLWTSTMRWQSDSEELEIWCGFSVKSGLVGPFFLDEIFADDKSNHPSKYKSRYFKMIEDHVVPFFTENNLEISEFSFQQDSDTIEIKDLQYLESLFSEVYSPGCSQQQWPLNSPDLSPVDFCIWDRFRGLLALELPKTKAAVKYWAKAFLARVSADHHMHAIRQFKIRLWLCHRVRGLDFKSELQRHNSSLMINKVCSYCIELHDCSCDECRKKCFFKHKYNQDNFKEPFNITEYVKNCEARQVNPFDFNR